MEVGFNISALSFSPFEVCYPLSSCLENKVAQVFFSALAGGVIALSVAAAVGATFPYGVVFLAGAALASAAKLMYDALLGSKRKGSELPDQVSAQRRVPQEPVGEPPSQVIAQPVVIPPAPVVAQDPFPEPVVVPPTQMVAQSPLPRPVVQACQSSPRLLQAVRAVDHFFRRTPILLEQSYDYHHFHHELTVITERMKNLPALKAIWGKFLHQMEGKTVYQPEGSHLITLHTGMERERLAGRRIEVITERLDPHSPEFERDLDQLIAIDRECFAGNTLRSKDFMRQELQNPKAHTYLAKRRDTGEILGYLWAKEQMYGCGLHYDLYIPNAPPHLHICSVGRKAEACSLGVADRLFRQLFAQPSWKRYDSVFLEVRASNRDAISLYQKWGFQLWREPDLYSYSPPGEDAARYSHPTENAVTMVLNPAATSVAT